MKKILVSLFFLIMVYSHAKAQGREIHLLNNDWNFVYGYEVQKSAGQIVTLPHTWNTNDAPYGVINYFRGEGIYQRKLFIPEKWKGKRIFLKFEGANTVANVFVNDRHIGEHRGGYTGFVFEITNHINYGTENNVKVRVTNAMQLDVMPLLGDFNFYGGIYRDVHLIITDASCISLLDHGSSGIYLTQQHVSNEKANVLARVLVSNGENSQQTYQLKITLRDGNKTLLTKRADVEVAANNQTEVTIPFEVSKPRLWNSTNDPFLYKTIVALVKNNITIDEVEQPLGLRYFSIDAGKGFFLNGKHMMLKGVCRHQDRSEVANALSPSNHDEDVAIMMDMGANAIRLSHYPHAPYFFDLLDKNGIITWSEIPFVGPGGYRGEGYVDMASFHENGKQQLIEMIRQNYNHPSVLFWGLFNELRISGDNPLSYLQELNALVKREDPYRLTTSANMTDVDAFTHVTDLVSWNLYFGWYGGNPQDIGKWADDMHQQHPEYKIGVSEYGAGASIYHHEDPLKKPDPTSTWHPEEWQAYFHEENWRSINERPFIWGTFIWNLFDFGASHRTEGDHLGRNDKGLVTFDRKIKKDAWWFYRASWNDKEPVLYITDRRFTNRTNAKTKVKVYTNTGEVELLVNGISLGRKTSDNATITWEDVTLKKGDNLIQVKSIARDRKIVDECHWFLEG